MCSFSMCPFCRYSTALLSGSFLMACTQKLLKRVLDLTLAFLYNLFHPSNYSIQNFLVVYSVQEY